MKNLLLTLGHNSSAILIEDNKLLWGYETERISGVKSDSRFPMPFVQNYLRRAIHPDMVYVTHWSPDGVLSSMGQKYWDPTWFDGVPIRTLSPERTHHDTHMAAARCYAGSLFHSKNAFGLVIDGFGILGENLSVYDLSGSEPKLVRRVHGYDTSLGLWYQYATAFMGMKMHEDEYKLLGYETHVNERIAQNLDISAMEYAQTWLENMSKSIYGSPYDPLYNLDALPAVKERIFSHLAQVATKYEVKPDTFEGRAVLAYYVQRVLEMVVMTIVRDLKPRHLICSGGVFYNVKLNKLLVDEVPGQICVFPLAGDQGNALGLYAMDHPEFDFPRDLNWGVRELKDVGQVPNLWVVDGEAALTIIKERLQIYGMVNLVRDNMEFGPRAMCNTSTLALPNMDMVRIINEMNDRNTVMPMAPVVTMERYKHLFQNWRKVWKSHQHMILALEYEEHPLDEHLGCAHEYWHPYHHHTGRPQVAPEYDFFLNNLLERFGGVLINTSFNYHGMPIALGMESIIKNHMMQYQRNPSIATVVIKNG